jgi:metallo-beta-lactamase family protein
MQVQFFGAAQVVTGSKHLITTPAGRKVLLDCGLFQGRLDKREEMNRSFGFEAHEVDFLILSHAHIDHSGLIPRLVRKGFRGSIYATPATISLCEAMLYDSAHIQQDDLRYHNARRKKKFLPMLEALYDVEDVEKTLSLMVPVEYDERRSINSELSLCFTDAGHLLGSAVVNIDIKRPGQKLLHLAFSGDIGRAGDSILRDPQPFPQCDVLICESTYGDRLHPRREDTTGKLLKLVAETCVLRRGKLIIPAFSVDRTQEIIYQLEKAANRGILPDIKVYVDSPLSSKATEIMRSHQECFRQEFIDYMKKDPQPFTFKNLYYICDVEESKALNDSAEPCIIISASGMAEAGRIKHHIKNNIRDANNTILLVGYCTPESLGGRLKAGEKEVTIFGEKYPVVARVESIDAYSAHADYEEIFTFLQCQEKEKIKKIFLVHGEKNTQDVFKQAFEMRGYKNIFIPAMKEAFEI